MARQRINLKFIGIGSGVLATTLAAVVGYKHFFGHRGDPDQLMKQGDAYYQGAEYEPALSCYSQVVSLQPKNGIGHLKVAETLFKLGGADPRPSLDEFAMAETYLPDNKAAWAGTLKVYMWYLGILEARPARQDEQDFAVKNVALAREAADHLVKLDPVDVEFASAAPIIDLRMWMLRLAIPLTPAEREMAPDKQPTEDQKVEKDMADLNQLLKKHTANEQIPYWLARAKIFQAGKLRGPDGGAAVADQAPLFAEAASEFDEAITANPKAVKLYLAKAEILSMLMQLDESAEPREGYGKQWRDAVNKAQELVDIKVSREDYFRAKQLYAMSLSNDPGRAEPVFKDLIKQFPERPQVSETYARILKRDPSRIKDALAVLDAVPAVAPPILHTQDQLHYWDNAYAAIQLERASIQIDQLESMPVGKARKDVSDQVAKALQLAKDRFQDKSDYLKALGRFQLSNGQAREAIDTLTAAQDKLASAQQPADSDVILALAQAYQIYGQPVSAINLYMRALVDPAVANNATIRLNLAKALISIKDFERAGAQVEWLKKRLPAENPTLVELQIALLRDNPDPKAVADLVAKLPEATVPDMELKAQITYGARDYADTLRICRKLSVAAPNDPVVALRLVQTLEQTGQKDEATRLVDDAVKKFPESVDLASVQKVLHDDVGDVYPLQLAAVQKIEDPFRRECAWAELDQKFSRDDEELEHRKKATEIQPDNIDVNRALFMRYLDAHKYAEASAMVQHLSDINADQAHGKVLQVRLDLAERNAADAVTVANQVVKDAPEFWESYELLGDAYRLAGQYDLAAQNYISSWAKQPANMDVLRSLIDTETKLDRVDEARRYIAEARKLYPDNPGYLATEVIFECQHGGAESLLPALAAAVAKNPGDQNGYNLYAEALSATYNTHVDKGELTDAQPFLDELVSTLKDENQRWPDDLRVARYLADTLIVDKDPKQAEQVVLTASQRPKWKDQPAGQFLVGRFYAAQGKFDTAEPFLRKTAELLPNAVEPQVTLADDLWRENKKDDALRVLKPVINKSVDAFAQYDGMLVKMGKGDQAESETNVALSANPKSPELNDLLIDVYSMNGHFDQAVALAKAVIKDDPHNIPAYLQLGKLLASGPKPDFDGAIRNVTVFSDAHPDDVEARILLGTFYKARNDRENATKQFQIAARLSPQDKRIRLQLLDCYLNSTPPRKTEAQNLVADLLGMQQFAHDPDFERAAAVMWAQNGENAKALAAIRDAVHQMDDPKLKDSPSKPAIMADYLRVLLLTKSYDALVEEADKLAADPKASWVVYSYRARGKDSAGDKAGAVDDFKISLDKAGTDPNQAAPIVAGMAVKEQLGLAGAVAMIKPRSDNSLLWKLVMIYIYQTEKDYNNALAFGEDAMKHVSELEPSTQRNLIRTVANLAAIATPPRYDRAAELFRLVLKDSPDDTASMNDLASVLLDSPDHSHYKEALDIANKAVQLSESQGVFEPRIYDTQGWAMVLNGQVDEGLEKLHKACDKADELPDAHYHLARGYLLKGHPDDAKREFDLTAKQIDLARENGEQVDSTLSDKVKQGQVDAKKMSDSMAAQGTTP